MLVLGRKLGEEIVILVDGKEIVLEFIDWSSRHQRGRIGITAGPEVAVFRKELWDAMQRQRQATEGDGTKDGAL